MITAHATQHAGPASIWRVLLCLATGAFCCCLGLAFVRDYRGMSSQIASRARDTDAQRVINKAVGWIFLVGGATFLYSAVAFLFPN